MKRKDLEVGKEYAVQSPSQRGQEFTRYGASSARKVTVLDTEPVWVGEHRSFYTNKKQPGNIVVNGKRVHVDDDRTREVREDNDYDAKEAKSVVRVLEEKEWGGFGESKVVRYIEVVPISHISRTWADFERDVQETKERNEAADQERRRIDFARGKLTTKLKGIELTKGVTPARFNEYRDEVKMTVAQYAELLERVES